MGILLCEQNFRDVWIRNKSVRAEIGHILRTHTQTHTHTTAAKLVVRILDLTNRKTITKDAMNTLLYADDLVLVANGKQELQETLLVTRL